MRITLIHAQFTPGLNNLGLNVIDQLLRLRIGRAVCRPRHVRRQLNHLAWFGAKA